MLRGRSRPQRSEALKEYRWFSRCEDSDAGDWTFEPHVGAAPSPLRARSESSGARCAGRADFETALQAGSHNGVTTDVSRDTMEGESSAVR